MILFRLSIYKESTYFGVALGPKRTGGLTDFSAGKEKYWATYGGVQNLKGLRNLSLINEILPEKNIFYHVLDAILQF